MTLQIGWTHAWKRTILAVVIACLPNSFPLFWAVASEPVSTPSPTSMDDQNPFFSPSRLPFQTPDFTAIEPKHFLPAIEKGMEQQLAEIKAIAEQDAAPTFENTLVRMAFSASCPILTQTSV